MAAHVIGDCHDIPSNAFLDKANASLLYYLIHFWLPRRKRIEATCSLVCQTLDNANVDYVLLRGLRFAEIYYPQPLLRFCSDVDLMVRREQCAEAEEALRDGGLQLTSSMAIVEAKRRYVGQTELILPETGIAVDLNWLLTANGQTGGISRDVEKVWARTRSISDREYTLAPEDLLLHLIRHVGQGHDFETGLVSCCSDVAMLLASHGNNLDWDYLNAEARSCSCSRTFALFSFFYNVYYRDESQVPLPQDGITPRSIALNWQNSLLSRSILVAQVHLASEPVNATRQACKANLRLIAKLCETDTLAQFVRLLRIMFLPSSDEVVLLTQETTEDDQVQRRLRLYSHFFIYLGIGTVLGCALRIMIAVAGMMQRGLAKLCRNLTNVLDRVFIR